MGPVMRLGEAHGQPEERCWRRTMTRSSWAPARPRGRDLDRAWPQGRRGQHPYRHRLARQRFVRATSTRSASASSCSAAATPRWIAAAPRAVSVDEDVKVVVRSGFDEMKASPWEKEDAMHEDIPILNFLVPKEFTHKNGKLTGMVFEKVKRRNRTTRAGGQSRADGRARSAYRMRRRARRGGPGKRLPLDRARHRHGVRQVGHARRRAGTMQSTTPQRVLRRRRSLRPKNIIWAVAHGHAAAVSIDMFLNGEDISG